MPIDNQTLSQLRKLSEHSLVSRALRGISMWLVCACVCVCVCVRAGFQLNRCQSRIQMPAPEQEMATNRKIYVNSFCSYSRNGPLRNGTIGACSS
jgi:hypothetical protein